MKTMNMIVIIWKTMASIMMTISAMKVIKKNTKVMRMSTTIMTIMP